MGAHIISMIEEPEYLLIGTVINDSTILAWGGEQLDASGCNRVYQRVLSHLSTLRHWLPEDSKPVPLDGSSLADDHRQQLEINWLCRICVRGLVILAAHQYPVPDHVSAVFYNLGCTRLRQSDSILPVLGPTEIRHKEEILASRVALRERFLLGHASMRAIKARYDELLDRLPPSSLNYREKEEYVAKFLQMGVAAVKLADETSSGVTLSQQNQAALELLDACFPVREICIVLHNYAALWRDLNDLELLRSLRSGHPAVGQATLEAVETSNRHTNEALQRLFTVMGWPLPK